MESIVARGRYYESYRSDDGPYLEHGCEFAVRRRAFLHQLLVASCGGAAMTTVGCGTILHQERIHEPHSRDIDWKIAALNGLGLALFFVPGVVAFVVDFYTGAIYLPPACAPACPVADTSPDGSPNRPLAQASNRPLDDWYHESIPPADLKQERIEKILSGRLGCHLSLCDTRTRISQFHDLSQLSDQVRLHLEDARHGVTCEVFFATVVAS